MLLQTGQSGQFENLYEIYSNGCTNGPSWELRWRRRNYDSRNNVTSYNKRHLLDLNRENLYILSSEQYSIWRLHCQVCGAYCCTLHVHIWTCTQNRCILEPVRAVIILSHGSRATPPNGVWRTTRSSGQRRWKWIIYYCDQTTNTISNSRIRSFNLSIFAFRAVSCLLCVSCLSTRVVDVRVHHE